MHVSEVIRATASERNLKGLERKRKRTIDFLEHLPHALNVVMIEEPRLWVLLVLLERDSERIGNIHALPVILPEQYTDYAPIRGTGGGARVVVCY